MNFTPVDAADIPAFARKESESAQLIKAFLESGEEAAELTDLRYSAASTASSLRCVINRTQLPLAVVQRQNRIFLVRERRPGKNV